MEQIIEALGPIIENPIARAFSYVIFGLLVIAVLRHLFGRGIESRTFDRSAPTLLTTLGVLGTFVGIFIGLLDFDVGDIDKSVPQLLVGLKIAFSTSIVGMGAAVSLKIVQSLFPKSIEVGETGPEEIYHVLSEIRDNGTQQREAIIDVRQAIAGDDETSLVTQLQKLRTSVFDGNRDVQNALDHGFKDQIDEFRKFAESMAENNTKALIEALERVIRDFNAQLNEQFGENFKQLNEAVGSLLTWQEQYRAHVEKLEDRFEIAVASIEKSEQALAQMVEHTAKIGANADKLGNLMTGLQVQITNLEAHLQGLAELNDKAMEAFPVIEDNLNTLTQEFRTYVQASVKDIETTRTEMQQVLRDSLERTTQAVEQQIQALDEQMQNEVTRVIETMGRGLASLSEKFVSDYGPLTDRLREVVRMAGRA